MTHNINEILTSLGAETGSEEIHLAKAQSDAAVDALLSASPITERPEEIQSELNVVEDELAQKDWFITTAAKPVVAARWIEGHGWDVQIQDDQQSGYIDPRRRNLLLRAINIAIRRNERGKQREFRIQSRKAEARKQAEIQAALAASRAAGTLVEYPGQKV
jgi:hypothetical protein